MATAQRILLERDRELELLRGAAEAAVRANGCAVLVRGEAGVGKTALLREAASRAAAAGLRVLSAAGSDLERDLGFALVRTLLGPVAGASASSASGGPADAARRVLKPGSDGPPLDLAVACHALHWLCSDLAEREPLALLVDDAHWSDEPSLRALSYLARRLDGVPILLVLAFRPGERAASVADLFDSPYASLLALARLSPAGTTALVRERVEGEPDAGFVAACHEATSGNPFLLRELIAALSAAGLPLDERSVTALERLEPAGVTRSLQTRLARLPRAARSLVQAAAVFPASAPVRHAAALAGLSESDAAEAADLLAAAEILTAERPLRFVHPLLHTAAYASQGPAARALAHRRVAAMLAEEGAAPEAVAAHLLRAEPAADPRAADALLAASGRALSGGAPETALALARRALSEPPPPPRRWQVLHAVGRAAVSVAWDEAGAILAQASETARDPLQRAQSLLLWTQAWGVSGGDPAELRRQIEATLPEVDRRDPLLAGRLRVRRRLLLGADEFEHDLRQAATVADVATLEGRIALVQWGWWQAVGAQSTADEAARAVHRALAAGPVVEWNDPTTAHQYAQAIDVLRLSGAIGEAEQLLDAATRRAAVVGDDLLMSMGTVMSAEYALERGQLADALALATTARDIAVRRGPHMLPVIQASGVIARALLERGDVEGAARAVGTLADPEMPDLPRAMAATAYAAVLLARDRPGEAAAAALAHGRGPRAATVANPAVDQWRAVAAEALGRSGDQQKARYFAAEALQVAERWQAPAPLGDAHRVAALQSATSVPALEHLSRAVELLRPTHARLWLARALAEEGAALRRAHRLRESRERLREAIDVATECGALVLVHRVRDELRAAGARPRRQATRGIDALTPSELRVCRLAANGLSNREIAQTLFVTLRTVETHLTASYAKLGIAGRPALEPALGPRSSD